MPCGRLDPARDEGEDMSEVDQVTKALIIDVGEGAEGGDCEIVRLKHQELELGTPACSSTRASPARRTLHMLLPLA